MKKTYTILRSSALACAALGLLAGNAKAALNYWDPTGLTGQAGTSGTWESSSWATAVGGQATPGTWSEANVALAFNAGVGTFPNTYTVTANVNHTFAGVFNGGIGGEHFGSVTIAGASGVVLSLQPTGFQGFDTTNGGNTTFTAVIGGGGGIQTQGSGSLFLDAANTYTGGTQLNTTAGVNFNNNSSFGTGSIQWGTVATGTAQTVMATQGSSPLTLGNAIIANAGTQIFVTTAAAPVTFNGAWTLSTVGTTGFQQNAAGTTVTINGKISGAAGFNKLGAGILNLGNSANNNTGVVSASAGTLGFTANNVLASTTQLKLNGGTVAVNGTSQTLVGTLNLAANSTIDLGSGNTGGSMSFANSSAVSWTAAKTITIANFNPNIDTIQVGTDATGLASGQLA